MATILKHKVDIKRVGLGLVVDINDYTTARKLHTIVVAIGRVAIRAHTTGLGALLNLVGTFGKVVLLRVGIDIKREGLIVIGEVISLVGILVREHHKVA